MGIQTMPNFAQLQRDDQAKADHNVLDAYKDMSIEERQSVAKSDRLPFSIALMNITGDLNTGVMIRSAHLAGAAEVLIFGRNKIDSRSMVGAENYTNVSRIGGLDLTTLEVDGDLFVSELKSRNLIPVYLEIGVESVPLRSFNWEDFTTRISSNKICLVFGNEGRGICESVLNARHQFDSYAVINIEQRGVMRSYNVASAASIVMYELGSYFSS